MNLSGKIQNYFKDCKTNFPAKKITEVNPTSNPHWRPDFGLGPILRGPHMNVG